MPGEANSPIPQVEIFTAATHERIVRAAGQFSAGATDHLAGRCGAQQRRAGKGRAVAARQRRVEAEGIPTYSGTSRWLAAGSGQALFHHPRQGLPLCGCRCDRNLDRQGHEPHPGDLESVSQSAGARLLQGYQLCGWSTWRPDLVWWSERDGWGHYYLYSAQNGELLHPITSGPWMSGQIVGIDQKAGELYFMGGSEGTRDQPVLPASLPGRAGRHRADRPLPGELRRQSRGER